MKKFRSNSSLPDLEFVFFRYKALAHAYFFGTARPVQVWPDGLYRRKT